MGRNDRPTAVIGHPSLVIGNSSYFPVEPENDMYPTNDEGLLRGSASYIRPSGRCICKLGSEFSVLNSGVSPECKEHRLVEPTMHREETVPRLRGPAALTELGTANDE
jgi:hypothetical protein